MMGETVGRSRMTPLISGTWTPSFSISIQKSSFKCALWSPLKAVKAPILLFNEADAIIGKRQEGAERAVDKMENSIQNIILQEMETLDGILIATTNLAQNMDKAFERRFLYKIKFEKPTTEAPMSMWRGMIPVLKEEEVRILATKYDFSGGQIENIARHYTIGNILHGESSNIVEELTVYCDSERLETQGTKKIGFCM